MPLRDGDIEKGDDENYAGHYFLNASSKSAPKIVDRKVQPILDPEEVYSGCYARVALNFYAFNTNGNKGIAKVLLLALATFRKSKMVNHWADALSRKTTSSLLMTRMNMTMTTCHSNQAGGWSNPPSISSIHIDLETYSETDLVKCGVYKYAEDPAFEILLFAYSVNEGPVQVVDLANQSLSLKLYRIQKSRNGRSTLNSNASV